MASPLIFDPKTLTPDAIPRTDCHLHTSWTDGAHTVQEVYQQACDAGLQAILYSEHARKTSIDWFPAFASEIRNLPVAPCRAFVGVECKVEDYDGNLDTNDEIAGLCDLVMASVHRFPDGKGGGIAFAEVDKARAVQLEYDLAWAALANPRTDILGHMFGMCLRKIRVTPPDELFIKLIRRAADYGVAVEVNSHYHPDLWAIVRWCVDAGAPIALGSNAHEATAVGRVVRALGGKDDA